MTEYSKNSRNQRAETGSRTGERSKDGPTHPYSHDQSDSPSQYSQPRSNQEETGDGDLDYNFQISLQYIMPLISAVKSENEHFKQQKIQMQGEMVALQKLSQGLLQQNQQLRRHYSARTNDIKRVVSTISINTNEQINDINHQAFLLKEHNCALVKGIEQKMKRLALINGSNTDKKRTLDSLTQENIQLQHAARDLAVKNKQLFLNCQQLRTQTNSIDTHSVDTAINNLLAEVVALRNTNKNNILQAKSISTTYTQQKPEVEENHNTVTEHNKKLEQEVNSLRQALKITERQLEERRDKSQTILAGLIQTLKSKEKSVSLLSNAEQDVLRVKSQIQRSSIAIKRRHQELLKLEKEKQQLMEQIVSRNAINRQIEQQYRTELQKMERNHKLTVAKIKALLHQQEVRANEQICSKVGPESTQTQARIEESKEEFAGLTQQVRELADKLARMDNPIKEILRLEYKLKKSRIFKQ